jgi:8-oxo-dGTP diphosphatase
MKKYNIRVYGLIILDGKILITDEFRGGIRMTKFPGGGNEWGEGLLETLYREFKEEISQEPIFTQHFYTSDFFVASNFNKDDQLICMYYKVAIPFPQKINTTEIPFNFLDEKEGAQIFRWVDITNLDSIQFTFPIDRKVVELLRIEK